MLIQAGSAGSIQMPTHQDIGNGTGGRETEKKGPGLTFIYEHEAEVVACGVLLVDFPEGWRKVEAAEEQADRDCLSCKIG
jgi:hypothetical protein